MKPTTTSFLVACCLALLPAAANSERQDLLESGRGSPAEPTVPTMRPGAQEGLAGKWQRDDSRGDRNYWMGEYPDTTLEIEVLGNEVRVHQSLGRVRDGQTLPGSGIDSLDYTLVLDGETREIAAPGSARRSGSARWIDGRLEVRSILILGGHEGDEPVEVTMNETWTVVDNGGTLRIERVVELADRGPRSNTIVFGRVRNDQRPGPAR